MSRSHRRATAATTAPRWLTAAQLEAWQAITLLLALLPTALEAQLQRDAQLSYVEYYVLAGLSDQPDHTMRISELAGFTNAELTDAGYNHLVAAAPGHVATVLELVIDALDDTALSALQDSAERITARINDARAASG